MVRYRTMNNNMLFLKIKIDNYDKGNMNVYTYGHTTHTILFRKKYYEGFNIDYPRVNFS